jgi:hypothetical protein
MTGKKPLTLGDVYCLDADWNRALAALDHDGDAKLMADLFRRGHAPPLGAMARIAVLLDPPKGYRGKKLKAVEWRGGRAQAYRELGEKQKIRQQVMATTAKHRKREAAVAEAMKSAPGMGKSRATIFNALAVDNEAALAKALEILGFDPEKKTKSKKLG